MAMQIVARGQVARLLPGGQDSLALPWTGPITVTTLLQQLGLTAQLATAVVNGQRVGGDHPLADGDKILLFSPMAGG